MSSEKFHQNHGQNGSHDIHQATSIPDRLDASFSNRDLFNAIEEDNYKEFKIRFDEMTAAGVGAHVLANSSNYDGVSLLQAASTYDRYEIAGFLLFSGSDPDCRTSNGFTPLYMATYNTPNALKIASLLLAKGCDMNAKSIYGHFPLYNALEERNLEVANLLIESGADINAVVTDDGGETALHIAAKYDDEEIALELITRGADINAKTHQGQTPVFLAALHNCEKMVKLLIDHCAGTDIKTNLGQRPVDVAKNESIKNMLASARYPALDPLNPNDGPVDVSVQTDTGRTGHEVTRQKLETADPASSDPALSLPVSSDTDSAEQGLLPAIHADKTDTGRKIFLAGLAVAGFAGVLILCFFIVTGHNTTDQRPIVHETGLIKNPPIVSKPIVYDLVPNPEPEATLETEPQAKPLLSPEPEAGNERVTPSLEPVVVKDKPIHLIVGSFKETANARGLMERLRQLGFKDCALLPRGGATLVSIEAFDGMDAAEAQKKHIMNDHGFDSWIFSRKH